MKTETQVIDGEPRNGASASLLVDRDARREAAVDVDAVQARVEATQSLAREMEEEAESCQRTGKHLEAALRSARIRRRSAWMCSPRPETER